MDNNSLTAVQMEPLPTSPSQDLETTCSYGGSVHKWLGEAAEHSGEGPMTSLPLLPHLALGNVTYSAQRTVPCNSPPELWLQSISARLHVH